MTLTGVAISGVAGGIILVIAGGQIMGTGQTTGAEPPPFFSQDADILLHAGLRGSEVAS